jgi:hypothetical protein
VRIRIRFWLALSGAVCLILTTGCGGLNASKGFSPLSLLLPGIMHYTPEKPQKQLPVPVSDEPRDSESEEANTA